MKRFRAHTHFVYLLCVHSLHMSLVTLAHCCFMLLCVLVSCNSFPVVVRKRPRMHRVCLFLREGRRWRMPLASPLVSPILVKRRSRSAAWPRNETAEYDQRLLEFFCGFDRRFPTAERNRRSYLTLFNLSGWNGGLIGGSETAVAPLFLSGAIRRFDRRSVAAECKRRSSPASLRTHSAVSFCGLAAEWNRRSASFKGNHVFSLSQFLASINTSFSLVLTITLKIKNPIFTREKKLFRLSIKHSNQFRFASYFIFYLLCTHRIEPCIVLNHHNILGMFFINFI